MVPGEPPRRVERVDGGEPGGRAANSVIRRLATRISQPRGLPGTPSSGHCLAAAGNASCTASSAVAKSPKRRVSTPTTCGRDLVRPRGRLAVDDPEPGEELLRLGERPLRSSPASLSIAFVSPMKAMCARISSGVQVERSGNPAFSALNCISSMYVMIRSCSW
ncbi:hypothetical protein M877_25300 [Streptomyces niveus NCIMB 11891]|nr:hypothetical protein M877_25300 [Streptomyces niveus NCIMB 11891]